MVDITQKQDSLRQAVARAIVTVSSTDTTEAIRANKVPKGNVFEFSRAAGLLAIKNTYAVIPDCHPLPVEYAAITHDIEGLEIHIRVEVHTIYKTGVEVEAMHGAAITALTMYDMLKPIDKGVEISNIRLDSKKGGKTDFRKAAEGDIKTAVVVCSDSISKGIGEDAAGKAIVEILRKHQVNASSYSVIADEVEGIRETVRDLVSRGFRMALFTGGTGLSPRDLTPDAIAPMLDREVPGIMEAARAYGQQRTPYAMLSRGIAGFVGDMLVITLPGSTKGAEESMAAIFPYVLHLFKVKEGMRHD